MAISKQGRSRTSSERWRLLLSSVAFSLSSIAPVSPASGATGIAIRADAAAEVATVIFQASATQAAAARLADDNLRRANLEIERLRAQGASASLQLAAAEQKFVTDLASRDRAYALEIAVYRGEMEDIASTPQGLQALAKFNAGDVEGALSIGDRLTDARARARRAAEGVAEAVDRRKWAKLALDGMQRGKGSTSGVIARFDEVVRLDPGNSEDWLQLARLNRDAGRLPEALEAVKKGQAVAPTDDARGLLAVERGLVASIGNDAGAAEAAFREAKGLLEAAINREPDNPAIQRDYVESLYRLADWSDDAEATTLRAEALQRMKGVIAAHPNDIAANLTLLEVFERIIADAADREDYRTALARISDELDAIGAMKTAGLAEAAGAPFNRARARVYSKGAEIAERMREVAPSVDWRLRAVTAYEDIAAANPDSVLAKEDLGNAELELGIAAIDNDYAVVYDGQRRDDDYFVEKGLAGLRAVAAIDPNNNWMQTKFAASLFMGAGRLSDIESKRARSEELSDEAATIISRLPNDPDTLLHAGPLLVLGYMKQIAQASERNDSAATFALIDKALTTQRRVVQLRNSLADQTVIEALLLMRAEQASTTGDARGARAALDEVGRLIREASSYADTSAVDQSEIANMYRGLGSSLLSIGDMPGGRAAYERAFAIQARLAVVDREITVFADDYRDSLLSVGERLSEKNTTAPNPYFERALDLYRASAKGPRLERAELARLQRNLDRVARAYEDAGNLTQARLRQEEGLAILRQLTQEDPAEGGELALALGDLGELTARGGDDAAAARYYNEALALLRASVANYPDRDRLLVQALVAPANWRVGRGDAAVMSDLAEALRIMRPKVSVRPISISDAEIVMLALRVRAKAFAEDGKQDLAWADLTEASAIARQLTEDRPDNAIAQRKARDQLLNQFESGEDFGMPHAENLAYMAQAFAPARRFAELSASDSAAQLRLSDMANQFITCTDPKCPSGALDLNVLADVRKALDRVPVEAGSADNLLTRYGMASTEMARLARNAKDPGAEKTAYEGLKAKLRAVSAAYPNDATVQAQVDSGLYNLASSIADAHDVDQGGAIYRDLVGELRTALAARPNDAHLAQQLLERGVDWARWLGGRRNFADVLPVLKAVIADAGPAIAANPTSTALISANVQARLILASTYIASGDRANADRTTTEAMSAARAFAQISPNDPARVAMLARATITASLHQLTGTTFDDRFPAWEKLKAMGLAYQPGSSAESDDGVLFEMQRLGAEVHQKNGEYKAANVRLVELRAMAAKVDSSRMGADRLTIYIADIDYRIAANLFAQGDYAGADAGLSDVVSALTRIHAATPADSDVTNSLFEAWLLRADARILQNKLEPAREAQRQALAISGSLIARTAKSDGWRVQLRGRVLGEPGAATWTPPDEVQRTKLSTRDKLILARVMPAQ